jgi:hypothetical protein
MHTFPRAVSQARGAAVKISTRMAVKVLKAQLGIVYFITLEPKEWVTAGGVQDSRGQRSLTTT